MARRISLSMNESEIDLAGYGDQAYILHEGSNAAPFLACVQGRIDYRAESGPDGDEIQSSRNEKRHHPRNSILDFPFVQAGPGGSSDFAGVGFGRLPKTGGDGDAHLS